MSGFSDDETFFMVLATVGGAIGAGRWYHNIGRACRWRCNPKALTLLGVAPIAALIPLFIVLRALADPVHVQGHSDYTLLFLAGGAMWLFSAAEVFPVLGLSTRDDTLERQNFAAAVAIAGAMIGVMLAYAGANIGNGPTIWTTLIPALFATLALLLLWAMLELTGEVRDAITIDRDLAAATRLGAFLVSAGAILGRGMAGDWHGWWGTFEEFIQAGWPVMPLLFCTAALNRALAPTRVRPQPSVVSCGVIPASAMLALAAAYVIYLGWPAVAPVGRYTP